MLDLKAVETIRDSNPIFQNKVSAFRSVPKFTCSATKPGTIKLKTIPYALIVKECKSYNSKNKGNDLYIKHKDE